MAQIVTITNPLTGQPAQVDQLDHTAQEIDDAIARALPGGEIDITLANKAPAGFGLGTSYSPEIDDCDTATKNGWYHVKGATLNKPFNKVGALLVACRGSTQMYQLFFVGETYDTGGSCIIVRSMYGGEWGPWEWVNPPMELGVEYRTTERYLGKPVYAMAVDFRNLPNATTKEITVSGVSSPDKVVSVFGYTSDNKTIPTFSYGWSSISTISDAVALNANAHPNLGLRINVATQSNRSSATAVIIVKYTKSTD